MGSMGSFSFLRVEREGPFARVLLDRPERRNAFDDVAVREVTEAFLGFGADPEIRAVVLAGAGPVFCPGWDVRALQAAEAPSESRIREDALGLFRMFEALDACPCPVIARVQGGAFGGGVGLLAASDLVVAAEDTVYSVSEVRLGLVPAVIAPLLLRRTGEAFARRYCLTAERFSASTARAAGLVHEVVYPDRLDDRVAQLIESLRQAAPGAVRLTKALLRGIGSSRSLEAFERGMATNVEARLSSEMREGIRAFLDRRSPAWAVPPPAGGGEESGTPAGGEG
jgi:methylglutaconyl-CoA hydratase